MSKIGKESDPNIERNIDIKIFYTNYLKTNHPTWSNSKINGYVNKALEIQEMKENLSSMMDLEKKIRRKNLD